MSLKEQENLSAVDNQSEKSAEVNVETSEPSNADSNIQEELKTDVKKKVVDESEERKGDTNIDDKKLYEEILEKLDIKSNQKQDDIESVQNFDKPKQENFLVELQQNAEVQEKMQLQQVLSQDFAKIQKLLQLGLINPQQGQNLKNQVLKKAFDKLVLSEKIRLNQASQAEPQIKSGELSNGFGEFNKDNPTFFEPQGRKDVLEYLKSGGASFGRDELNKISELIRTVEKSAIDRYLQKSAHEKTLQNSNENAKQRLTANAQKSSHSNGFAKTFTREQIGKMSSAEFTKNEPFIMEQLKKGLIK